MRPQKSTKIHDIYSIQTGNWQEELKNQKARDLKDEIADMVKIEGYPDGQAFMAAYNEARAIVSQYKRELAAWEQHTGGEKPPEKESIRKKLRELQAEARQRPPRRPQRRSRGMER